MIKKSLVELVTSLRLPDNYFQGQRTSQLHLPDNILCWHPHELIIGGPAGYHQHHRFVLMLSVEGSVAVVLDQHIFRLAAGRGVLCFPFQQHTFLEAEKKRAWLWVTFELAEHDHLIPLKNRLLLLGDGVWPIAAQLVQAYQTEQRPHRTSLLTALLLDELLSSADHTARPESIHSGLGLFEKVNQAIWASLASPLDIQSLAEECAISASHLRFLFRRKFKKSLGRYIRETKINRARDYLATTDMSVSEVADACGFASLYAFSRAFKAAEGASARQYRDRAKAKER